jgi:hypothetical protein
MCQVSVRYPTTQRALNILPSQEPSTYNPKYQTYAYWSPWQPNQCGDIENMYIALLLMELYEYIIGPKGPASPLTR